MKKALTIFLLVLPWIILQAQTVTLPPYYGVQKKIYQSCGNVTDANGNIYGTIVIGSQCWLKENLRSTKYNDGTNIPNVTDNSTWANLTSPAYCWYDNSYTTYGSVYGALYNWHTVDTEKLCPIGWHVPSKTDWNILSLFLEGDNEAGGFLKETGTAHWLAPNTGATNGTGFTGLPGGCRYWDGGFGQIGMLGNWWATDSFESFYSWTTDLQFDNTILLQDVNEIQFGFSVRCVKD